MRKVVLINLLRLLVFFGVVPEQVVKPTAQCFLLWLVEVERRVADALARTGEDVARGCVAIGELE